jgi:hypothetical protein
MALNGENSISLHTTFFLPGSADFVAARNIAKFYAEDDLRKGDAKATIDCVNIDSEEQHVGAPFAFHNLEIGFWNWNIGTNGSLLICCFRRSVGERGRCFWC